MLKIVIIEDERLTAQDLINTLHKIDLNIEVQAVLTSVEEAVEYFQNHPFPNLLFSDIQLPDGTSFEIFEKVKLTIPIIFCTAYDQYALQAFNVNGIDYLLKPFSKDTVSKSIDKYKLLKGDINYESDIFTQLKEVLRQEPSSQRTSVIVYQGDKIIPILLENIALFFLEDKYVFAYTFEQKRHIVSKTMDELEVLCGTRYFRANRQYLVNRKAIKNAARHFNRKILIQLNLDYPDQILIGKLKTTQFLDWLAGY